jgi:integrase
LVEYTKNYDRRTVPLAPQALAALDVVPRVEGQSFIFFGGYGKRLSQRTSDYYWHRVKDVFVAKLPGGHWVHEQGLTLYALRHFFASELALQGVDTRDIATMLGHRDDGQLARMTYIHRREEDARERVRRALWAA